VALSEIAKPVAATTPIVVLIRTVASQEPCHCLPVRKPAVSAGCSR
jgi:hypothetical protein